jgi:hypothetical protein
MQLHRCAGSAGTRPPDHRECDGREPAAGGALPVGKKPTPAALAKPDKAVSDAHAAPDAVEDEAKAPSGRSRPRSASAIWPEPSLPRLRRAACGVAPGYRLRRSGP